MGEARKLTVQLVEDALGATLAAIELNEERRARKPDVASDVRSISAAEIMKTDDAVFECEDMIRDPVGTACREQVRLLGWMLFRLGGTTQMGSSLTQVAGRSPASENFRSATVDRLWDGIGDPDEFWAS